MLKNEIEKHPKAGRVLSYKIGSSSSIIKAVNVSASRDKCFTELNQFELSETIYSKKRQQFKCVNKGKNRIIN